jgi:Dolichyl-phosphate-mannose-protein mannosyltransferase
MTLRNTSSPAGAAADESNAHMGTDAAKVNRRIAAWLFFGFLAFNITFTRGHFYLTDEVQVFQQARSLFEHGDLSVAPNINTVRGRGGKFYAQYGIGQSVLALPFYATGKWAHEFLERHHAGSWIRTFEGPVIGDPDKRWGGEVEIFFVNLFCAFVMAGLMVLFFRFSLRIGAATRWAVVATVLLGFTTHVAGFGVEFLQHPAEAFLLFLAFYLLFDDAENPRRRDRVLAGVCAGVMILVRASAIVLIPALTLYLFWNAFRRSAAWDGAAKALEAGAACVLFLIPVFAGIAITMFGNYVKWGELSYSGSYAAFNSFDNSWLVSLYGFLFSPGQSIFIFSPILLLAPFYFRPFARKYAAETGAILGLTLSYALFYGRSLTWHGQWCFGPRYLMALVPLLVLPLGLWLGRVRPAAWFAILPLAAIGAFIEILHIAVNVSYVIYREGYDRLVPRDAYIFVPRISQLVTHYHALLAFDDRVDLWLINVGREFGAWRVIEISYPLFAIMLIAFLRVNANLARLNAPRPRPLLQLPAPTEAPVDAEPFAFEDVAAVQFSEADTCEEPLADARSNTTAI